MWFGTQETIFSIIKTYMNRKRRYSMRQVRKFPGSRLDECSSNRPTESFSGRPSRRGEDQNFHQGRYNWKKYFGEAEKGE